MPHIQIFYDSSKIKLDEFPHRELLDQIKSLVKQKAPALLSVEGLELTSNNFSFTFHPSDPRFDELRHTIQLVIPAHHFPERADQDGDPIARQLRVGIELIAQELRLAGITVSVALHLFTYGYSSSNDDG